MEAINRDFCTRWELGLDYLKNKKFYVSPTFKFFFIHLVTFNSIH